MYLLLSCCSLGIDWVDILSLYRMFTKGNLPHAEHCTPFTNGTYLDVLQRDVADLFGLHRCLERDSPGAKNCTRSACPIVINYMYFHYKGSSRACFDRFSSRCRSRNRSGSTEWDYFMDVAGRSSGQLTFYQWSFEPGICVIVKTYRITRLV